MPLHRSFYFIRHGETDWNKAGVMQGHTDIPLNDTGISQAQAAARAFATLPVQRVYCSDLLRARRTAEIINAERGLPMSVEPMLRERSFGIFEGKTRDAMQEMRAQLAAAGAPLEESGYPLMPEAEPYAAFRDRVVTAVNNALVAHPAEQILFVAHGGVFRMLSRTICGIDEHCDNARFIKVTRLDAPAKTSDTAAAWRFDYLDA